MLKRGDRIRLHFDDGKWAEGSIRGVPGETIKVYGNDEIVPDNHYRVIYYMLGYAYYATVRDDRVSLYV